MAGPDAPPCPFKFTPDELQTHDEDGEGWNEKADFWDSIAGVVSRDGWVSQEDYDQAFDMFADLREEGLTNLEGKEREEFEASTRWAIKREDTTI